ncbi:uncharacterized protein LOC135439780 [Drosophila montana]|uniref:uncharacterized protein LOC135439780 n=1 Tax=Drosophila montana TaxID=40370 RepID=UPI00313B8D00
MVERFNRTLLDFLAKFVAVDQREWDQLLPLELWAYRSAPHETTGFSLAQLMFDREPRLPSELMSGRPTPDAENSPAFVKQLRENLRKTHQSARQYLRVAADVNKVQYDLRSHLTEFAPGDFAWLYSPIHRVGRCPKLQSNWIIPTTVVRRLSDFVYKVRLPGIRQTRTVLINRLPVATLKRIKEKQYNSVIKDYLDLNHMKQVPASNDSNNLYLPPQRFELCLTPVSFSAGPSQS